MGYLKYTFLAVLGWGCWAIGSKLLSRHFNASSTTFWISFWSIIMLSVIVLVRRSLIVNTHAFWAIPVAIASLIAILSFYKALKTGPTSIVMAVTNMYIVLPVLFGILFLKESLTLTKVIGFLFAAVATVLLSI